MSETVMEYMAKFGLDTTELSEGLTGAAISFDALAMEAEIALQSIEKAFDATIGAALEFGETIQHQANVLGDSTDNMQRLRAAAIATNTDFDSVTQAVKMFSQRIDEGGAAGDKMLKTMSDLGVSLTNADGSGKPMSQVYLELNDALGKVTDVTERNQDAVILYGKAWGNTANMIVDANTASQAAASITPVSAEQIKAAADMSAKLAEMSDEMAAVGREVGDDLMPMMQELLDAAASFPALGDGFHDAMVVIDDAAILAVGGLTELIDAYLVLHDLSTLDFTGASAEIQNMVTLAQKTYGNLAGAGTTAGGSSSTSSGGSKGSSGSSGSAAASGSSSSSSSGTSSNTGGNASSINKAIGNGNTLVGFDSMGHPQYSTNPYYDSGAIENQGVTSGGDISDMIQYGNFGSGANDYTGTTWETGQQIYDAIVKFAKQDSSGNPILAQIASFDAQDYNIVNGEQYNPNYSFGSGQQTGVSYVQSLMDQYTASKNPTINTVVNVPAGSDAQAVANATAEAVSRALARQVST